MHSYSKQKQLGSYTINKVLIEDMEHFIRRGIPQILNLSSTEYNYNIIVTIHYSYGKEIFTSIKEYKHPVFRNGTHTISIKADLCSLSAEKELELKICLACDRNANDFSIALSDENPREKVLAIETGLRSLLHNYKNANWLWSNGTALQFFLAMGIALTIGCSFLMEEIRPKGTTENLSGILFSLNLFYFFLLCCKDYCSFETVSERKFNRWFMWISIGIPALLILIAFVPPLRIPIIGF